VKNKPPYAIESVDNALRILQVLRDSGQARVSDVAAELGIARSTAHRLLAMLVYRDFAIQAADRSYRPGPALSAGPPPASASASAPATAPHVPHHPPHPSL
jgi:DNA-binding IclR family transcriptional regulator